MKVINMSKKKFNTLEKYQIPSSVSNTECELYIVVSKEKWKVKKSLLKKLYIDEGEMFGNKLLTINTLIDNKEEIGIEELVLPEKLAVVNKKVVGFTVPFIENNTNLSCLLNSLYVPTEQKINYLKQVGDILKKVQKVQKYKNNFYVGDVHEGNFVVDKTNDKVYAVDMDSCSIANNQPSPSKYIASNRNIKNMYIKYPVNKEGIHIPNEDTEWMCYILMILNCIANGPIHKLSLSEYYLYLDYLRSLGFSNELLDCFNNIYINCNNYSPEEILDQIPSKIGEASFPVFQYKIRNKKFL